MDVAHSIDDVPIRLSHERWYHIVENHDDLASYFFEVLETIEKPTLVVRGNHGTLKAAKNMGKNKWLIVVYKEVTRTDGFVLTAYFLSERPKGAIVWQQQ